MIDKHKYPVEWALLLSELDEAIGHLNALVKEMGSEVGIDESDFAVQLGHAYAHLNRSWHARHGASLDGNNAWVAMSAFPTDLDVVA